MRFIIYVTRCQRVEGGGEWGPCQDSHPLLSLLALGKYYIT